jgi:hypothetical protein
MSGKESAGLKDSSTQALLDWLKKGGLKKGYKINKVKCPDCSRMANSFESPHNLVLIICPHCIEAEKIGIPVPERVFMRRIECQARLKSSEQEVQTWWFEVVKVRNRSEARYRDLRTGRFIKKPY